MTDNETRKEATPVSGCKASFSDLAKQINVDPRFLKLASYSVRYSVDAQTVKDRFQNLGTTMEEAAKALKKFNDIYPKRGLV